MIVRRGLKLCVTQPSCELRGLYYTAYYGLCDIISAVSTAPAPVPMKRTGMNLENFREKKNYIPSSYIPSRKIMGIGIINYIRLHYITLHLM